MTTDTTNLVHVVVPHFSAITEFAGYKDDCGPCANEVCMAAVERRAPTTANMNAIRERDIERGWFTAGGGQTLENIQQDVEAYHPEVKTTLTVGDAETVHKALHDACVAGNPCVLNLFNATALPGNEPGVHRHFVAIGGIDTMLGYQTANGDEYPFGRIGTYWVKWNPGILQAQPVGVLVYHMPAPTPPPPPTDDQKRIEELTAELAQAHAKIQAAEKALTA